MVTWIGLVAPAKTPKPLIRTDQPLGPRHPPEPRGHGPAARRRHERHAHHAGAVPEDDRAGDQTARGAGEGVGAGVAVKIFSNKSFRRIKLTFCISFAFAQHLQANKCLQSRIPECCVVSQSLRIVWPLNITKWSTILLFF